MSPTTAPDTHTTTAPNPTQIRDTYMKVLYLGMGLTLGFAIVLLLTGYFLKQSGIGDAEPTAQSKVLFYALIAVAMSELPVALFLKKSFLKPLPESSSGANIPTTSYVLSRYLILFNLAAACNFYGFVWYLLGGTMQEFVLFAAIGLIIFRVVRPSIEYFFSLFGTRPAIE
jgi:hypothetical protein